MCQQSYTSYSSKIIRLVKVRRYVFPVKTIRLSLLVSSCIWVKSLASPTSAIPTASKGIDLPGVQKDCPCFEVKWLL